MKATWVEREMAGVSIRHLGMVRKIESNGEVAVMSKGWPMAVRKMGMVVATSGRTTMAASWAMTVAWEAKMAVMGDGR